MERNKKFIPFSRKRNKKDPTFGIYQVKTLKEMFMFKKLKKFCLENEMQYGDKKSTNKRL